METKSVYYNSFWFDTQSQVDEFKRLEGAKISQWPQGVHDLIAQYGKQGGLSGEVYITALRDWIVANIE